jgi:AcrR family transcriptional regulator
VDAPAKEITELAGVGVGTLYRHFPQRSDLVKAVVESGIDAAAAEGAIRGDIDAEDLRRPALWRRARHRAKLVGCGRTERPAATKDL